MKAPAAPWIMRNSTISSRLLAMPHSTEAAVKAATLHRNRVRRPMRAESQPVSGVAIAVATI